MKTLESEAVKLANYARYLKFNEKNEQKANAVLTEAFSHIKCFEDGLFAQTIVKYLFPERLSEYAEIMYSVAETFFDLTYSLDFFRRCDLSKCPATIMEAEEKAVTIEDYLQLCGILDILDKFHAEKLFQKAEQSANNFEDYMIILSESSYFYGWPELLDKTRVAKIAGTAVSLAETARDYLRFGDFCAYFAKYAYFSNSSCSAKKPYCR